MDSELPDRVLVDISDKFKDIIGFEIDKITFKRKYFRIDTQCFRNPLVSINLEEEIKIEFTFKYDLED